MKKLILILALLLSACGAPTSHSDTPTPVDTETAAPSPTTTATIKPSATLMPSSTPTSITVVVSPPTSTALPFQKPDADSYSYPYHETSPNGNWIAWVGCCADVESNPHMIVENLEGDISWLVTFPHEYQIDINYCSGGCYMNPVFWSPNGEFLYFETHPVWDLIIPSFPILALMRLTLHTGEVDFVLPPQQNDYYHFAFSNDGEWLVHTLFNPPAVNFTMLNLLTEQTNSFTFNVQAEALGIVQWSPDDQLFVLHIFGENWQNIFYVVNTQNYSFQKIYEGDFPLDHYEWYSPTEIKLTPLDYSDELSILINIQTGEITSAD